LIILGIDPGLNTTGYGIIDSDGRQVQLITFGAITTRRTEELAERLKIIFEKIQTLLSTYQPDILAIEDIFYHENVRTAIVMGQARGVCMLAAKLADVPIFEYAPKEIKMSLTGNGGNHRVHWMPPMHWRLPFATITGRGFTIINKTKDKR